MDQNWLSLSLGLIYWMRSFADLLFATLRERANRTISENVNFENVNFENVNFENVNFENVN
jgi:uncharacterized protein YjbI with pentapeptide repeats